ncbi:protein starmaker-like isoform X3 [Melanotaenia boesemani]|uniref:protein starmaker-like isoform X3 n=2 Tax=Melanotaenia boesemani TaxID=1250792 RepID=UPI001C04955B|nr:protein starmaker-like isoform X3 [Melanotaenia boesemani]
MDRFKRRLRNLRNHHQKCEERFENARAKKDHCPSSSEHTPVKERRGDEPDKACYPPPTPSPSVEDEESLLSSYSGSDADYKPSSPSSSEDEVLAQESESSCHSAPENHHSHSSSETSIWKAKDQKAKDGEVPHSAAARSPVKRLWQTARRRHDEDGCGADEDDGINNTIQGFENADGELQEDTNTGKRKMTTAKQKHDDDDLSDGQTGPDIEKTDEMVYQERCGTPPVEQNERSTEKRDDDGWDEKDRKGRVKRQKENVNKRKRQVDDDWDGEERQTADTRSPLKGRKKTAATRERNNLDVPEMEVKKQGKRPWTDKERTAVKRQLAKFIALKKVPAKEDCMMCICKESPVLRTRSWKDVKYFVYNEIVKIKKKLAFCRKHLAVLYCSNQKLHFE